MLRNKFTLLGVAAVLVGSSVGLATSASATTTLFNTSAASVQCGSIIAASASIAPPLSSASTGTYGQFTLAGQTFGPKSAFIGGTPSTVAATSEDVGQLGAGCLGAPPGPGIKTIHLALGVAIG